MSIAESMDSVQCGHVWRSLCCQCLVNIMHVVQLKQNGANADYMGPWVNVQYGL